MGRAAWQWRRARSAARDKLGFRLAAPLLWSSVDPGRPLPPLPSPSELFGRDPTALRERRELPDASGIQSKGPQAAHLHKADREWLVELALADDMPLPATADREGYLGDDHLGYWLYGLGDALWLKATVEQYGLTLDAGSRVLDFGCSTGRVLRHFRGLASEAELRGIEIASTYVAWARANLPSSIVISQGTVIPGLPFPEDHFDLIYAGSVFTHIDEFEETWLAELSRVLKPGGVAVLTFHPGRLWGEMVADREHFIRTRFLQTRTRMDPPGIEPVSDRNFVGDLPGQRVVFRNLDWPIHNLDTIHTHEWIRDRWGAIFKVEEIVERAHGDHQDAMVGSTRPGSS
jgi:SAM-dependent methyltransferase